MNQIEAEIFESPEMLTRNNKIMNDELVVGLSSGYSSSHFIWFIVFFIPLWLQFIQYILVIMGNPIVRIYQGTRTRTGSCFQLHAQWPLSRRGNVPSSSTPTNSSSLSAIVPKLAALHSWISRIFIRLNTRYMREVYCL